MNKDDRKVDFSVNDSKRRKSYTSLSWPNPLFRFSEMARRYSISTEILHNPTLSVANRQDLQGHDTKGSLKVSFQRALERELTLSHALSRTQVDLTEKEIQFEEAVEDCKCLKMQIQDLSSRLEEQLDINSSLQGEIKTMKGNIDILKETIDEQRTEILAMAEALKTTESVAVHKLEELPTNGLDRKKIERSTQELFRKLRLDLEWERSERINIENEKRLAMRQLNKTENKLRTSCAKVIRLEQDLLEKEQTYRSLITSLSAEKAHIDADCERWKIAYGKMQEHILQTPQSPWSDGYNSTIALNNTIRESENLFLEISAIREESIEASSTMEVRQQSDQSSPNTNSKPVHTPTLETSEEIQKYLHITASVVKLHFPEYQEVSSKWLIDMVKHSPFYLYHDLMMNLMRQLNKEKAQEETKVSEGADAGWVSRFFRLARSFPMPPKIEIDMKSRSKQIRM